MSENDLVERLRQSIIDCDEEKAKEVANKILKRI